MRVFDVISDKGDIYYSVPATYLRENEIITVQTKDKNNQTTLQDIKVKYILAVREVDNSQLNL